MPHQHLALTVDPDDQEVRVSLDLAAQLGQVNQPAPTARDWLALGPVLHQLGQLGWRVVAGLGGSPYGLLVLWREVPRAYPPPVDPPDTP